MLVAQDHVALFELGAHPFLTLTLFIAMFERDHGPLEYQIAYGQASQAPVAALPRHRDLTCAVMRPPCSTRRVAAVVRRAPGTCSPPRARRWCA